jgi:hypothetical protein
MSVELTKDNSHSLGWRTRRCLLCKLRLLLRDRLQVWSKDVLVILQVVLEGLGPPATLCLHNSKQDATEQGLKRVSNAEAVAMQGWLAKLLALLLEQVQELVV